MRYKAIAAAVGAASLLAMGIVAAESSTESSDSEASAVLVRPSRRDHIQPRWPAHRFRRSSRQHHPADSPISADCVAVTTTSRSRVTTARDDRIRWRPARAGTMQTTGHIVT